MRRQRLITDNAHGRVCAEECRLLALSVAGYWQAPRLVLDYLSTGDMGYYEGANLALWNYHGEGGLRDDAARERGTPREGRALCAWCAARIALSLEVSRFEDWWDRDDPRQSLRSPSAAKKAWREYCKKLPDSKLRMVRQQIKAIEVINARRG